VSVASGSERPRGLTVELAGIPGAGKSRLARTFAAGLTARGVPVLQPQNLLGPATPAARRLARKAAASAAAALRDPGTSARSVRAIARSGQPGAPDVAGRVVQWLVAQHVTAVARRRGAVSLVDEGLVQCLWSIGLRGDVEPVLTALASARIHRPDVLVVVRVDPEIALARLAARASRHSRTQLLPESDRLTELTRGDLVLERLVAWCSDKLSIPVIDLAGSDDAAADRELVLDRLASWFDSGRDAGPVDA
jgi:thymidylate kinase